MFSFQVPLCNEIHGTWPKKNTQSLRPKYRFSPISTGCTSTRIRITKNLVEDSFLRILFNFEIKKTLFDRARKKIQNDDFLPKKVHNRPFESFKNSSNHPIELKIYQHTQIE
jgi:hypothetical protein